MIPHLPKLVRFSPDNVERVSNINPYFLLAEAIEENSAGSIVFGISYRLMLFVKQHLPNCHVEAVPCGIALSSQYAAQAYNIPILIERLPDGKEIHHFMTAKISS